MIEEKRRFPPFLKQCFVTSAVILNVFGQGCVLGFPTVLLAQLQKRHSVITISEDMETRLALFMSISTFFGILITPPIMMRLGRKAAHYSVMIPLTSGWFSIIWANNTKMLLIGRIFHGLSYGMLMPIQSIIIGEYTSPKYRGGFLATIIFFKICGVSFIHLIGSFVSFKKAAMICMMLTFASFIVTFNSPETPSWLAKRGKLEQCKKVFIWLRGIEEMDELETMIEHAQLIKKDQSDDSNAFKKILLTFKKSDFHKPIILVTTLNFIQQFSEVVLMATYSPEIIAMLIPNANQQIWMTALDTLRFILSAIAVFAINKINRRTVTFVTGVVCTCTHLFFALVVCARLKNWFSYDTLLIPGLLISSQIISIVMGIMPLPSVIAGEVFPLQHRGIASIISFLCVPGTSFYTWKMFNGLISTLGLHGTYALYSGILAVCLVVVWFLLPETRWKTLHEIEEQFRRTFSKPNDLHAESQEVELKPLCN